MPQDTSTSLLTAAPTAAAPSSPALLSALTPDSVPARGEWEGPRVTSAFPRTTISQQRGVLCVLALRPEFEAAPIIVTSPQASVPASVTQWVGTVLSVLLDTLKQMAALEKCA